MAVIKEGLLADPTGILTLTLVVHGRIWPGRLATQSKPKVPKLRKRETLSICTVTFGFPSPPFDIASLPDSWRAAVL